MSEDIIISDEVSQAIENQFPVVALESTVITHGLPYPENLNLAMEMENEVRARGAIPATIAVIEGKIRVGIASDKLRSLAEMTDARKISLRDFGSCVVSGVSGGTTVAGTMYVADKVGIKVFATGGIGGVHRSAAGGNAFDISTDLLALSKIPVIVVSAGAKAILDLPATVEYLETLGVPVVGFQTDEFPAFYSPHSGLGVSAVAEDERQAALIAIKHWELGFPSALLVVAPPPSKFAIAKELVDGAIKRALEEAQEKNIQGQEVTPFLLEHVNQLTQGQSLRANLGLLLNNAGIASRIVTELMLLN
jgi:pseudouridine-5'-phosphate glycosidase